MLNVQDRVIKPMVCEDGDTVAIYDSREEAEHDAEENLLGNAYGFEVFETEMLE
jgi:hypothetical protein